MTSTPLLLFAFAARQIPLWTVGVLQYITPTLQFLLGVLAYDEDWSGGQVAGYSIIWFGLIVFAAEGVARARRMRGARRPNRRSDRGAGRSDAVADRRTQRVAHDGGDHLILTRLGQVVAHVGEHEEPRAGDRRRRRRAARRCDEKILEPMDHQGGPDLAKAGCGRRFRRSPQPDASRRRGTTSVPSPPRRATVSSASKWSPEMWRQGERILDGGLLRARRLRETHRPDQLQRDPAVATIAGVRHHRAQRTDLGRMVDRQRLADHAPIDMPTTCIDSKPRASIGAPSSAMSSTVYPTP